MINSAYRHGLLTLIVLTPFVISCGESDVFEATEDSEWATEAGTSDGLGKADAIVTWLEERSLTDEKPVAELALACPASPTPSTPPSCAIDVMLRVASPDDVLGAVEVALKWAAPDGKTRSFSLSGANWLGAEVVMSHPYAGATGTHKITFTKKAGTPDLTVQVGQRPSKPKTSSPVVSTPPEKLTFAASMGAVTFLHAKHAARAKGDCKVCHDELWPKDSKAALGYRGTMHKPAETKKTSCATCHVTGGVAFASAGNCTKCHVK